jgi:hypothetical protein
LRIKALSITFGLIVVTLGVGWLVWSVVEWRHGRTASNAVLCTVLLIPTMLLCLVVAFAFVMGASPPSDLFSKPRNAPWDRMTKTTVVLDHRRPFKRGKYAQLSEWPPANVPVSLN